MFAVSQGHLTSPSARLPPQSKPQNKGQPMPPKKSAEVQALAKAIRSTRERSGYAQESVARRIGVDRTYYGAIERGTFNVTVETLVKIARGLDTTCAALFALAEL
jgi:DNA-binding XRE family transcriptional regulator